MSAQSHLYAATHCAKVGQSNVFESCLRTVDWKLYRAWCIKDACVNPVAQSVCTMISALAFSCAIRGVHIDWMRDDQLAGFCRGNAFPPSSTALVFRERINSRIFPHIPLTPTVAIWVQ